MKTSALFVAGLLLFGCTDAVPEETPLVVPEGKEDNFLSRTAQEYLVEGESRIVLDAADAALPDDKKLERVKRLIPYKQVVVSWFLNAWIAPKDSDDANFGYGGFSALTKNGSFEDLNIKKVDARTYSFTTRQQLAGQLDLLKVLPTTTTNGRITFDLAVGRVSNSDMQNLAAGAEWFRSEPWEHFDPRKGAASGEFDMIKLTIKPQPRSLDGWLDTPHLFADGKVTIGVHFGWDYHSAAHISGSKEFYAWLTKKGFKSPVASYEKLTRTSGPFTKTITANKKPVKVEVSMFWGKPGADTDPDTAAGGAHLREDLITSLETREVIIYSGHSGPFWGFSMANWNKTEAGELDDNELASLDLPQSYQLVLAEGCETYAIGEAFFANPAKAKRDNLDIVTTTTYSTAEGADPVVDFLEAIVGTSYGKHVPWLWSELLQSLDYNAWDPAMYGVHGIDDAPHLHPYADSAKFCAACTKDSQCGAEGNFCANLGGSSGKVCTAACTGDDGCPTGFVCAPIARDMSITGSACVPRSYSCKGGAAPSQQLLINEVLADPPNGDDGDINGDGLIDPDGDEFVELYNASAGALRIDGWTVSDGTAVRFTFPSNTSVPKGHAVVVFGGGSVDALAGTGALMFIANGLFLANAGDTVVIRNSTGAVIDRLVYGSEGGKDRSLVRARDGDKGAAFVVHPGSVVASPGLRTSGSAF